MNEDVNFIGRQMTRRGYLEAAIAFGERFEEGHISEVRLKMIRSFWSRN